MHYVYDIQSKAEPERFFVGSSTDTAHRLKEHNAARSIHTNKYRPCRTTLPSVRINALLEPRKHENGGGLRLVVEHLQQVDLRGQRQFDPLDKALLAVCLPIKGRLPLHVLAGHRATFSWLLPAGMRCPCDLCEARRWR